MEILYYIRPNANNISILVWGIQLNWEIHFIDTSFISRFCKIFENFVPNYFNIHKYIYIFTDLYTYTTLEINNKTVIWLRALCGCRLQRYLLSTIWVYTLYCWMIRQLKHCICFDAWTNTTKTHNSNKNTFTHFVKIQNERKCWPHIYTFWWFLVEQAENRKWCKCFVCMNPSRSTDKVKQNFKQLKLKLGERRKKPNEKRTHKNHWKHHWLHFIKINQYINCNVLLLCKLSVCKMFESTHKEITTPNAQMTKCFMQRRSTKPLIWAIGGIILCECMSFTFATVLFFFSFSLCINVIEIVVSSQ